MGPNMGMIGEWLLFCSLNGYATMFANDEEVRQRVTSVDVILRRSPQTFTSLSLFPLFVWGEAAAAARHPAQRSLLESCKPWLPKDHIEMVLVISEYTEFLYLPPMRQAMGTLGMWTVSRTTT